VWQANQALHKIKFISVFVIIKTMDTQAKIIWDYMKLDQPLKKCDVTLVLCSIDERVAEYAAELFLKGYGDYLVFSGGVAHQNDLLAVSWEESEAEHFAEIAIAAGVRREKIVIENKAQNTGENIAFSYNLLKQKRINTDSILLIQKPYMERRTFATFKAQWPKATTDIVVSSPPISYENYFNESNTREVVLNIMVGDLQRIKEYPKLGFQIEQDIPQNVWRAYEQLVAAGYTKHLMK
jgi:uncharacterized SAM-binding protein YcdF (DUF218 family)